MRARGGVKRYEVASKAKADSWASTNMLVLGIVILGIVFFHLTHFWADMQLKEFTGGEAETIAKTVETSKAMVQQSLGRTDAIMEIYREKDGKAEVQIAVSCDGGRAKAEILKLFGEEEKELKAKLEKLLDGAE